MLRPEVTYSKSIKYFSSFTGTFKDVDADYEDKSIVKEIFGKTDVEGLKAYQGKKELTITDGKVLGLNLAVADKYKANIRLETDDVVCHVNMNVYTLVIQRAEDLKLFELKILQTDDPSTHGIDETEVTFIDGYCELINNIDATGIKINHSALNTTYDMVNANGEVVQVTVNAGRYNVEGGLRKYGFCGIFNGKGYTISNLDTSVSEGEIGGGLFGYILGGAVIKDVAFTNMNISNSSGIAYGAHVPIPTGGYDNLGLKKEYTEFKNIFISLAKETENPKGAIISSVYNTWNGVYNFSNIIIDARGLKLNDNVSGGVLTNNTFMLYYSAGYKTRQNVIVISDEYPVSFDGDVAVYGQNQAGSNSLDKQVGNKAYAKGIYSYASYDELALSKNNYSDFSSSWSVSNYPIFKSAFEVLPMLDEQMIYDGRVIINSTINAKALTLVEIASGDGVGFTFENYDQTKLVINADGEIKLANDVLTEETTTITIKYQYKDKDITLDLLVRMLPSLITVDDEIVLSSLDGDFNAGETFESSETIISAWQIINEEENELTVESNGNLKGIKVITKADYSDVEYVTLKVRTNVTDYLFTSVKAYSKIIKTASDLKVLQRSSYNEKSTGYYVLDANINADGLQMNHTDITLGSKTNVFQGVFDGRGYTISNFKPTEYGFFGAIYSDTDANGGKTIIRNVGFVHVQAEQEKNFTILGYYLDSSAEGVRNEITNVHVQIDKTYTSFNHTTNFLGLFHSNSAERSGGVFNNFKMTNVYVEVTEEIFNGVVEFSFGTIMSRDHLIVMSTQETRSARFSNVVTVSKASPIVWRQSVNGVFATEWGIHMYFAYAQNDVGKVGLGLKESHSSMEPIYPHNPIKEDKANGCYVINNVYRYDNPEQVESDKAETFISTGYWNIKDGKLVWAKAPLKANATEDNGNFNPDWLDKIQ